MKTRFINTLLILTILSSNSYSQDFLQNHKFLAKTNILQSSVVQQWNLTAEFPTKKESQSNAFGIGYNRIRDGNDEVDAFFLKYGRVYYSKPYKKQYYASFSPYGKFMYRDVYRSGFGYFIPSFDFTAFSLAGGIDVGLYTIVKDKICFSLVSGGGLGIIVIYHWSDSPIPIYLDGQLGLKIGYIF